MAKKIPALVWRFVFAAQKAAIAAPKAGNTRFPVAIAVWNGAAASIRAQKTYVRGWRQLNPAKDANTCPTTTKEPTTSKNQNA